MYVHVHVHVCKSLHSNQAIINKIQAFDVSVGYKAYYM